MLFQFLDGSLYAWMSHIVMAKFDDSPPDAGWYHKEISILLSAKYTAVLDQILLFYLFLLWMIFSSLQYSGDSRQLLILLQLLLPLELGLKRRHGSSSVLGGE